MPAPASVPNPYSKPRLVPFQNTVLPSSVHTPHKQPTQYHPPSHRFSRYDPTPRRILMILACPLCQNQNLHHPSLIQLLKHTTRTLSSLLRLTTLLTPRWSQLQPQQEAALPFALYPWSTASPSSNLVEGDPVLLRTDMRSRKVAGVVPR